METLSDGALPCVAYGLVALPTRLPGTGPHAVKAGCAGCGRFLKWLPKPKEVPVASCVNRVILIGLVSKYGIEVSYLPSGTAKATFTLLVHETRQEKEFTTYIPCEVFGKGAEAAGELEAGALVLCEGKIGTRKKGDGWEVVVQSFELKPIGMERGGTP
jgi:primosomal replication protein N